MGRGYSNSRCKSARPTLGSKRQRSLSMQHLKEALPAKPPTNAPAAPRVIRRTETPLPAAGTRPSSAASRQKAGAKNGEKTARGRSASTIRQRIDLLQTELADVLEPSEKLEETIVRPDVMTKYKSSGRAIDEVMDLLSAACVPGANTKQLCDMGDEELLRRVRGMFSKAKDTGGNRILRGLAYPTNVSVNHTLCNHTPLTEAEAVVLRGGDVVKIHMGCHIDGYPVSAARTVIVPMGAGGDESCTHNPRPLTQRATGAIEAARVAIHGMIHLLQPGAVGADVTDFIHRVGNHFNVEALEGVLSNRTKRWVPDGMDCIITRRVTSEDPCQDVADCVIGANEVWTLDVAFTDHTSYKVVPAEEATTIYRRTEVDYQQDARIKSVHGTLQEITEKHQCFPFSLKHVENPLKARMAVAVLRKENVIDPLPVLRVKGDRHITARFSATVSVSERRVTVLCGLPPAEPLAVPDDVRPLPVPSDIAEVLAEPLVFAKNGEPQQKKARMEKDQGDKKVKE